MLKGIACALTGHSYGGGKYVGETGKMCFSIDCARPEIEIHKTCKRCGKIKVEFFMSGMPHKVMPLTPQVASQCLRYMK